MQYLGGNLEEVRKYKKGFENPELRL